MVTTGITAKQTIEQYKFAGHETFHLRDGWLYKGLKALQVDNSSLHRKDAHHKLGIGINMLKSLVYWLQATNLARANKDKGRVKPILELTPLADLILQRDTYFEDVTTLWLLHIQLCSNRNLATFWYWVFNECPQRDFTEERLIQGAQHFIDDHGIKQVAKSSLVKDARCLIRTYLSMDDHNTSSLDIIECPLASLGLMRSSTIPLAAFNLIPFGPFDGRKIFKWNKVVWFLVTVLAVGLFSFILSSASPFDSINAPKEPNSYKSYNDLDSRFSFNYPANWIQVTADSDSVWAELFQVHTDYVAFHDESDCGIIGILVNY